jgi:hypothetical protein
VFEVDVLLGGAHATGYAITDCFRVAASSQLLPDPRRLRQIGQDGITKEMTAMRQGVRQLTDLHFRIAR